MSARRANGTAALACLYLTGVSAGALGTSCLLPSYEKVPYSTGPGSVSGRGGVGGVSFASGGSGGAVCASNAECMDQHYGEPYLCRAGGCLALKTPECPLVIDQENLRSESPILIGAYSVIGSFDQQPSPITLAYQLAIDEFTEHVTGLYAGPGQARRPIVAIVCDADRSKLDASISHLVDTVEVPGVLASLYTADLRHAFETKGLPNDVFFLNPLAADNELILSHASSGLLWHMLSSSTALAPTYVPLIARVESYLQTAPPLRLALVDADTPFLQDLAEIVHSTIRFNGVSPSDNGVNYQRLTIRSEINDPNADVSGAVVELLQFAPHVIVSLAGGEFLAQVMPGLEFLWPTEVPGQKRPFYVLSPYQAGHPMLYEHASTLPTLTERLVGVNFAAAEDPTLYQGYMARLTAKFRDAVNTEGTENFYDAAYFLMFAMAGAGNPAMLRGTDIARGMGRLLSGPRLDVEPSQIGNVLSALAASTDGTISLNGALGPPDFDPQTHARSSRGSVWCLDSKFEYDVLRYDDATATLMGSVSCLPGF